MKVLVTSRRIQLVQFEESEADYRIFAGAINDFNRNLDLPWHPLFLDFANAYRFEFSAEYFEICKKGKFQPIRILKRRPCLQWIGSIAMEHSKNGLKACLSFHILKKCRGQGFGTEALEALSTVAREIWGIQALCAGVDRQNYASARLFRHLRYKDHGIAKRKRFNWAIKGHRYFELILSEKANKER